MEGIANAIDNERSDVLSCLLDIGEAMIGCGADVRHTERVLSRVGYAYGATKMNVLVITAAIVVTVELPSGMEHTETRRIRVASNTNFEKLESLNDLCRECCKEPLSASELRKRFDQISAKPMPSLALYLGGILASGGFAVFFGGSWIDGMVSSLLAIFVCWTMRHWRAYLPNNIVYYFVVSLICGLAIGVMESALPMVSGSMVTIGVIMLLIPGVAMTNATRDLIAGDTISGVMRFVESLLWATSLALGFMLAMAICEHIF